MISLGIQRKKNEAEQSQSKQCNTHAFVSALAKHLRKSGIYHPLSKWLHKKNLSTNLQPTNLGFNSIHLLVNQDHVCKGTRTATLCNTSKGHNCSLG